jgi:hypothetical protein
MTTSTDKADLDDFFGADDTWGPQRDRYGRPMLIPTAEYPGLTAEQRVAAAAGLLRVPYTRASSMANYIANFMALHVWEKRRLAKGLAERPDLCAVIASLPKFENDSKKDRLTNARISEVMDLAMEIGQVHEQANWGTAIHQFTEPGVATGPVPSDMRADVKSFFDALREAGIKVLDTEVFTAHDRNKVSGTVDHELWVPGYGKILGDKKTGDLKPLEFAVQFVSYRDGDRYDWETDERTPWDDDVNADYALVLDIPAGKGKTLIHELDLNYGRDMAALAAKVRDGHEQSRHKVRKNIIGEIEWTLADQQNEIRDLIAGSASRDEIVEVARLYAPWWDESLNVVARARVAALS